MFANKQYAHIFIANLAVVNLLACICTAVTIVSSLNPTVGITEVPCGIIIFGNLPLRPLVLLSLTLLTIKRFYAIVKGNTSKVCNRRRSLCCVYGIGCLCKLVMVSVLIITGISSKTKVNGTCSLLETIDGKLNAFYFRVTFICFCAITLCNIEIRLFVRSHNRRITEESGQPADVARARNIKLGRLVAYMSLSYVTVFVLPAVLLVIISTTVISEGFS